MPLLLLLAMIGPDAAASTVVTVPGASGAAEICRFPAGGVDPLRRWFAGQPATCADSGSPVSFTPGRWNVFARTRDAVSSVVLVDGNSAPAALTLDLVPSATVRVELPPGQNGVLYVPGRVSAYPAAERTLVPAGEEVWLFIVSRSAPGGVVVGPPLDAGSERTIDGRSTTSSGRVVGWLQLSEADRTALSHARGIQAPKIRISAAGNESASAALPAVAALDGALVLLGGRATGEGELEVSGRGWIPSRQKVKVDPHEMTLLKSPIVLRASATLIVNWSTSGDLAELESSFGSCEPSRETPQFVLTISSCAEPLRDETCQAIRRQPLPPEKTFGNATIEEIPPGFYRAELRYGRLPPVATTAQVAPAQVRPVPLVAEYLKVYGSALRGGKPLGEDARIDFPGAGVGFVARDTDEYHAVILGKLGPDARVDIVTCRGEHMLYLADRPMIPKARYDIDVPDNVLSITAVDTFTRMPLSPVTLRYVVMSLRTPRRPVITQTLAGKTHQASVDPADASQAQFVIKGVPERELRLQLSSPGYEKKDLDPFSMTKSETKTIEAQLVPLNGSRGKVVSSRPFERAAIYWYSPAGRESEQSDVDSDGTFFFDERAHVRDETMVVVSLSHPLWVARAPVIERRKPLEIGFPDGAPVRNADVLVPGSPLRSATWIGIVIGGLRVPAATLALHLQLRGLEPFVRGAGPLHLAALAATGPIDILRGPTMTLLPAFAGGSDTPVVRDFVPTATRRLEGREVVFDAK